MGQKIIIGLPKTTHCFRLKNYTTSNNHLTAVDELNESIFSNTSIHINSLPNNNFTNFNNLIEASFANNPTITSIIHQNRRLTSNSSLINNNNSTSSNNTSNNNNFTSSNDTNTDFDKNKDNFLIASNENTACNTDNIFINDATATVATDLVNYKNSLINTTDFLHKIHTNQKLNDIIINQHQTPTQVYMMNTDSSQELSSTESSNESVSQSPILNNSLPSISEITENNQATTSLHPLSSSQTIPNSQTASTTSLETTNNTTQTHNMGLHQAGPCNNNNCPLCNPENSDSFNPQNIPVDTEIKSTPDQTNLFIENTYSPIAETKLDPDAVTIHNQSHDMNTSFMQWNQLFQQQSYYRPITQQTMTYDQFASLLTRLCEIIVQMNSQFGSLHSLNNAILEQINYDFGMQPSGSLDPEYVYHGASNHLRVLLGTYTTELTQYKQAAEQFKYLYSQILNVWPSFHYHAFQNPTQLGHFLSMRMPSAHHHQALINFISQMNQFNFNYTHFLTHLDTIYMTHLTALQQTYHDIYAHLPYSNEHIINLIYERLTHRYPFSLPSEYYIALRTIIDSQNNSPISDHIFPNFYSLQNISDSTIENYEKILFYQSDILRALKNIIGPDHPIFLNRDSIEDIAARELFTHIPWATHRSIRIQAENSWLFMETLRALRRHNTIPASTSNGIIIEGLNPFFLHLRQNNVIPTPRFPTIISSLPHPLDANANSTSELLQNLFTNFLMHSVNSLPFLIFTILSFIWNFFIFYLFCMAFKEQAMLHYSLTFPYPLPLFLYDFAKKKFLYWFDVTKKKLKACFNAFINFFHKFF